MQGYRVPCSALLAPEPALNFRRGNHERCVSYFTLARNRCSPADPHADRRGAFCSLGTFLSVSACCPAQIDQQPHRRGSPEAHPRNENRVTAVPFRLLSPPAASSKASGRSVRTSCRRSRSRAKKSFLLRANRSWATPRYLHRVATH